MSHTAASPATSVEVPTTRPGLFASRTSLTVGFALLVLVAVAMAWLIASSVRQSREVYRAFELQVAASRVFQILQSAETGQRGYLLTDDPTYLAPYDEAVASFETVASRMIGLATDEPAQEVDATVLRDLGRQKMNELGRSVALARAGSRDEAIRLVQTDLGRDLMARIRSTSESIQVKQNRILNGEYQESQSINYVLLVASTCALLLVIVLGAAAINSVGRHTRLLEVNEAKTRELNETLEQTVEQRTAELRETNEEIQRYAYIVSHDLRAPLVNVMGFTSELEALRNDLIAAGAKDGNDPTRTRTVAEFDESIGFIKAAISKMEGLISAILRLSREGQRRFRPEHLDMTALVKSLADAQHHQAEAVGAEVVVTDDLPALEADRLAVEQIFGNLIDNAIKYLDGSRRGRIEISGQRVGKGLRFDVRDNGRGIAAQDHGRVFELFRRAGQQDRPGEGIGLAHVQTLVRSLGGRIDLASEPGKGTTFSVFLPPIPRRATTQNGA
jgi:signal transduction histidine kinase